MKTTRTRRGRRRAPIPTRASANAPSTATPEFLPLPDAPAEAAGTSLSLSQLAHDLANAVGGARLQVVLIRAKGEGSVIDPHNLDALERLLNQACDIEEALQASIRPLFPKKN